MFVVFVCVGVLVCVFVLVTVCDLVGVCVCSRCLCGCSELEIVIL